MTHHHTCAGSIASRPHALHHHGWRSPWLLAALLVGGLLAPPSVAAGSGSARDDGDGDGPVLAQADTAASKKRPRKRGQPAAQKRVRKKKADQDDAAKTKAAATAAQEALQKAAAGDVASEGSAHSAAATSAGDPAPAPPFALRGADADYPALGVNPGELIDATNAILETLPPLNIPALDPDLLQFGLSYSASGGTGTLPGTTAEVARCGVHLSQDTVGGGSLWYLPEAVGSTTTYSLAALQQFGPPVCCSFDEVTGAYRCGDPAGFPNQQEVARSPGGDELGLVCFDLPTSYVDFARQDGITNADGSNLAAGNTCCNMNISYARSLGDNAVHADFAKFLQQCSPSSVAQNTGFGRSQGQFAASTEIYGEGALSVFAERRDDAYGVDVRGRLSLLSQLVGSGGADTHTLRAQLRQLEGVYRRYFDRTAMPWFAFAGLNMNTSTLELVKVTDQDLATHFAFPLRVTLGGGLGRIYDIEPRIRLRKLEAMLMQQGVTSQPIPHDVARDIMIAWWVLRAELGHDQRMLYTFKLLRDAGLLTGPVTMAVVHRFGQLLADPQLARRRQGARAQLGVRLSKQLQSGLDGDLLMVFQGGDERIFNLSYDEEFFWDARVALAPRKKDWADNLLPGERTAFSGVTGGVLAADLPVGYRLYRYDEFLNKTGLWELRGRVALGYGNDATILTAPSGFAFTVGCGAKYSLFRSVSHGIDFALDADLGRLNGKFIYGVVGSVFMTFGRNESYYVAPAEVEDALPFDLPLPPLVTGR